MEAEDNGVARHWGGRVNGGGPWQYLSAVAAGGGGGWSRSRMTKAAAGGLSVSYFLSKQNSENWPGEAGEAGQEAFLSIQKSEHM